MRPRLIKTEDTIKSMIKNGINIRKPSVNAVLSSERTKAVTKGIKPVLLAAVSGFSPAIERIAESSSSLVFLSRKSRMGPSALSIACVTVILSSKRGFKDWS